MKAFIILCFISLALSETIKLPEPDKEGGIPLNEALSKRKSERDYHKETSLTDAEISQILFAAYGPNRPDHGLTVPSAVAGYPFDVYVFLEKGTYIYRYKTNELEGVTNTDLRAVTGTQDFVANANMNVCLVGYYDRITYAEAKEAKEKWMRLDVGYVTQNMYLAAASLELQAVSRAMFDQPTVLEAIGLSADDVYIPLCFSVSH